MCNCLHRKKRWGLILYSAQFFIKTSTNNYNVDNDASSCIQQDLDIHEVGILTTCKSYLKQTGIRHFILSDLSFTHLSTKRCG